MPRIFGIEFNPFKKLRKVDPPPPEIHAPLVTSPAKISSEEEFAIINAGFSMNNLSELIAKESIVNYERYALYREIDRAYLYPLMSAAVELYADVATTYSSMQNATVWVTGEKRYVNEITRLFDRLSLEEKIFDWTHTTGTYGDFILRVRAQPGTGVLFVEDDDHPINISRLDYNGRLVGFYDSPLGGTAAPVKMMPPWDFVHFRLLGVKRKRPIYCLRGNSRINLLNGTSPQIADMAAKPQDFVGKSLWSIDPVTGNLVVDSIKSVQKTRLNAQMVRVHLDTNQFVDCTPDHQFMLRDGTFLKASELAAGDRLMPYTVKPIWHNCYKMIYSPGKRKYVVEHQEVVQSMGGVIRLDDETHHWDFCGQNNDPDNLQVMSEFEHKSLHARTGEHSKKMLDARWSDPQFRGKMLGVLEKARRLPRGPRRPCPPDCGCAHCLSERGVHPAHKPGCPCYACGTFPHEVRSCACGCGQTFRVRTDSHKWVVSREHRQRVAQCSGHPQGCDCKSCRRRMRESQLVLNHKVVSVERLDVREDTYDLTTEKNHNFPVNEAVFVHNSDPMYTEFRTVSMIDPETRRITGKYGMSLLMNALPIYKRLRLSEDSLMMARLSKGPLHYVFKLKVEGDNAIRIRGLVEQYKTMLKRQKALNTAQGDPTGNTPNYEDIYGSIPAAEDIFLPVWGDAKNDLTIDKLGGEPDIRWITDIDLLRNQLACALRVPLQLLGGFTDEMPSSLGRSALERMDIRFARSARRLQRSMINGLTRMAQIHLAYIGLNPNLNFFKINMPETSSAEEEELKDALDKGVDVVDKLFDMTVKFVGEDFDKLAFLDYLNEKILKLNDMDLKQFSNKLGGASQLPAEAKEVAKEAIEHAVRIKGQPIHELRSSDLRAMLPMNEKIWRARYGAMKFGVYDGNGVRLDSPEGKK